MVSWGEGRVSTRSLSQGSGAQATPIFFGCIFGNPNIFGTKFCMVVELNYGKIVAGSTEPPALAKIFGDTNANRQSVEAS